MPPTTFAASDHPGTDADPVFRTDSGILRADRAGDKAGSTASPDGRSVALQLSARPWHLACCSLAGDLLLAAQALLRVGAADVFFLASPTPNPLRLTPARASMVNASRIDGRDDAASRWLDVETLSWPAACAVRPRHVIPAEKKLCCRDQHHSDERVSGLMPKDERRTRVPTSTCRVRLTRVELWVRRSTVSQGGLLSLPSLPGFLRFCRAVCAAQTPASVAGADRAPVADCD